MSEVQTYGRRSYDPTPGDEISKMLQGSDDSVHRAILLILQKVELSLEATNGVLVVQGESLDLFRKEFLAHDERETKDRAILIGAKKTAQWFIGGYAALLVVILSLGGFIFSEYKAQLIDLRATVDEMRIEQAVLRGALK